MDNDKNSEIIIKKKKRKKTTNENISDNIKSKIDKNEQAKIIYLYLMLIILIILQFLLSYMLDSKITKENEMKRQEAIYSQIKENYNTYVKTIKETKIYKLENNKYIENGSISENTEIALEEKEIKDYEDIYFKLKNINYYVKYEDVEPVESITLDDSYARYIPFNLNVITNSPAYLYSEDGNKYVINEEISAPIIIKDTDRYYIEYDNKLLYIKSEDTKQVIDSNNTTSSVASSIAVVLYHYVYSDSNKIHCTNTVICHSISQVESHFNYLKENNYYTTTMKDLDLWLDGKIRLPKNSVTITIDDGWFLENMISLLEKYEIHGTLFLITSLAPVAAYTSNNLEIHSHTDNLHYVGACPGGQGSPIKCLNRQTILDDLSLSREKLNNTTYFSWPFYEYNDYSLGLLKEAGFTMSFRGGMIKATPGMNKFLIPRYTIHNATTVNEFASYIK